MFVILIPVLTCLDLILKYAVSSFDNKDLPRTFVKKIEIDKFHNKGFPFGKLKENQKAVKYFPVLLHQYWSGYFHSYFLKEEIR